VPMPNIHAVPEVAVEGTHIDGRRSPPDPLRYGTYRAPHLPHIAGSRTPHVSEHLVVRILPAMGGSDGWCTVLF
jgi:hypothetical protein